MLPSWAETSAADELYVVGTEATVIGDELDGGEGLVNQLLDRLGFLLQLPHSVATQDTRLAKPGKWTADTAGLSASMRLSIAQRVIEANGGLVDAISRGWSAIRRWSDMAAPFDARSVRIGKTARDATVLTSTVAKALRKAIGVAQGLVDWCRPRCLGIYRHFAVRELPWLLRVWKVGPRVLEMLVGEKRNVQLLVEAADGQPIQVDSQPPVVIEFLDGNQVKQDFGWVETGNKVFYAFAPENPGQYVLEFTISVDNGRQVLKHRVSVHVKS